jgi:hypothetical protein
LPIMAPVTGFSGNRRHILYFLWSESKKYMKIGFVRNAVLNNNKADSCEISALQDIQYYCFDKKMLFLYFY